MTKVFTSVVAVLIGAMWIVGPAAAQTTSDKMENKAERAKDKVEDKAERAKDKTESKTESTMDKVKEKAHEAKDKMVETKDKVVDKVKGKKDSHNEAKVSTKAEDRNVRAAQQALRDQGFNPGPIDGVMGPRTSAALRDYQTKEGLTASGQLDDATMDKLGVRAGTSASPATEPQTTAPGAQKPKQSQ
jgi:peptidoglycan hydrolase-like protein with peptidoglycan-binding domain